LLVSNGFTQSNGFPNYRLGKVVADEGADRIEGFASQARPRIDDRRDHAHGEWPLERFHELRKIGLELREAVDPFDGRGRRYKGV
jgi:hypothetical protein